jgi:phosphohistidine phosphatase
MTKTLLLLRHAKSSWKNSALKDPDRPLNGRGRKAAELIGRYIRAQKIEFPLVLCSPATRARETLEIVLKASRAVVEVRYDERIYDATPVQLLQVISEFDEDKPDVLLVGHNPGIEELLALLTGQVRRMPSGAIAQLDTNATKWEKVSPTKSKLVWRVKPKDLE